MKNKSKVYTNYYYVKDNTLDFSEIKRYITNFDFSNMKSIRIKWDRIPNSLAGWVRLEIRSRLLKDFNNEQ